LNKFMMITSLGLLVTAGSSYAARGDRPNPVAELDSNDDGAVNFEEFMEGRSGLMARLDSDDNGVLSLDEFLNGRPGPRAGLRSGDQADNQDGDARREERRERMARRAEERFMQMDLDGDELVTEAEFKEATFQQMDRDNNGLLEADELRPPRGPANRGPGRRRGGA